MSLQGLGRDFINLFNQQHYEQAAGLLPKLKLALAKENLLVPSKNGQQDNLVAAGQVLEAGIITAIHTRNEQEMNRLFALVRPFYSKEFELSPSANESKIKALYLLLLVAKNEIAEFHTELESLTANPEDDPFLSYPVKLERWLMEGSYDRVWRAITQKSQFPTPEFAILAESLVNTVRGEIALCTERAYSSLPISNARHLLFLKSDQDIVKFANEQAGWSIRNGRICFPDTSAPVEDDSNVMNSHTAVPSDSLIANTLDYAREIETII
jgi:26S proteasome regulatory subunit N12